MKTVQSLLACLCVLLTLAPTVNAQAPAAMQATSPSAWLRGPKAPPRDRFAYGITKNYRERPISSINMNNSVRLESLVRGNMLYLALSDAIALALENNIDIEIQRYGPELAKIDFDRAQAGGLLRGVNQTATQGAASATNFITGGGGLGGGTVGTGGGGGGTALSGTVFQVTGSQIPNLDPVLTFSAFKGKQSSPQSNSFTTGLTALVINTQSYSAGISKQFLTGSGLSLNYDNSVINTNSPTQDLNFFNRGNLSLNFTQRLLQGFGRAVNNRNIRIARNSMKVSDLVFKQQVINTVSSTVNLYWDLVSFNENVKVKQQSLAYAQRLYSDRKKEVEIGTLAPIEIVRAEAEVARNQQDLTIAETQVLQQETILKNQLSRTGVTNPLIASARIVTLDRISVPEVEALSPIQDLIDLGIKTRPEVEQTRLNIDNTRLGLAGSRSALLPALDFSASTSTRSLAGAVNTVPFAPGRASFIRQPDPLFVGNYGTALGQLFRRNFPEYNLGFQLNVPLRNRAALADIANDTLRLRQQELQEQRQLNSIKVDVQNALIALQQARAQFQASVKNRDLQEQTLSAEQKKYALGSSTVFFVIQAQRDLAVAQQAEVSAMATYSRARTQMDLATGSVLSTHGISLDEAMAGTVSKPASLIPAVPPAK
ncbi:MAG: TolC family protein [Bryobacteraceae bacterium]|nr:TolC family protein [Bryobacteraceae bacterium]